MMFLLPVLIFIMIIAAIAGCLTIFWALLYIILDLIDSKEDKKDD